jgi:hypothetical protein
VLGAVNIAGGKEMNGAVRVCVVEGPAAVALAATPSYFRTAAVSGEVGSFAVQPPATAPQAAAAQG